MDDDKKAIEEIKARVLDHLKQAENPSSYLGRTKGHLMAALGLRMATYLPSGLPESRALDRALQDLRKDQKIIFVNRQWALRKD